MESSLARAWHFRGGAREGAHQPGDLQKDHRDLGSKRRFGASCTRADPDRGQGPCGLQCLKLHMGWWTRSLLDENLWTAESPDGHSRG